MTAEDTSALLLDTFVELADTLASGYKVELSVAVAQLVQLHLLRCLAALARLG
jgi:hypothetical protein